MADMDDKDRADAETAATNEGATPAAGPGVQPAAGSGPRSDWTASDSRGPLVTASETSGSQTKGTEPTPAASASDHRVEEPLVHDASAPETVAEHPINANAPASFAPAPDAASSASAEPRRSILPIAAGLVIGALIGAGSAALVYNALGGAAGPDPQVAGLASRVDALEKRSDGQADMAALKTSVADLGDKVAALQKAGSTAAAPTAAVDLTPFQEKIAALQSSLDTLKGQSGDGKALEAKVSALESDIAGTKKDSSTNQASIATVAGQQKVLADKVMVPALAVVADSLVQQIAPGQPYSAQVEALAAIGADPVKIAILRQNADKGVPSAKMLATAFEPLGEPISATAHKAPPNAGFVDRLKSGMFSMVSIRSADDTSGTDLPSRVARIKVDLAHDDVADALATWDALPAGAKTKGEAWSALAKTSAEAMNAARALQHDAIAALGAKKS